MSSCASTSWPTISSRRRCPGSVGCLHAEDEKHWIFEADLVNYKGIGRFILGLFDHIEILSDDGLKAYIKDSVQAMSQTVAEW